MPKSKFGGVQKLAFEIEVARHAVGGIAAYRKLDRGQMGAYLMRAPRLELDPQQRMTWQLFHDFEVRHRRTGRIGAHGHLLGRAAVASQRRVDRAQASCLLYTSPSPRDGLLSRMP